MILLTNHQFCASTNENDYTFILHSLCVHCTDFNTLMSYMEQCGTNLSSELDEETWQYLINELRTAYISDKELDTMMTHCYYHTSHKRSLIVKN